MKKIIILSTLILCAFFISAQETSISNLSKKELKEKKKLEKEKKLQEQFETHYQILLDSSFVLKANYITYKTKRYIVDNKLNFILVDSMHSIIQHGLGDRIGFNNVGGLTAKGNITNYKLSKNEKRKSLNLSISVNTMDGRFDIIFNISANGNANASAISNSWTLIYDGIIVPLKESDVNIGVSWYR